MGYKKRIKTSGEIQWLQTKAHSFVKDKNIHVNLRTETLEVNANKCMYTTSMSEHMVTADIAQKCNNCNKV